MRLLVYLCSLIIFCVPSFAQEEIITLNSPELEAHKRPLVRFAHENHSESIDCAACHHDYDVYGVNESEEEGQRCAECHTSESDANPIPLMRAFHRQCKGCHQKLVGKAQASGPLMCGQCHVRATE